MNSAGHSKVAWVTGASSGLGRAIALQLAARGYLVAATARRIELLASLERESGGRCRAMPGDVTELALMRALVDRIEKEFGPIDLAVFNAGYYDQRERGSFNAATAWLTIEANLGGAMRCADAMLGRMLTRGSGHLVFVASLAGYGGIPGSASYSAAKSAIIRFAEALRLTYAQKGITVQVANLGFIRTDMVAGNDYAMPFIMDADEAAARLIGRLGKGFEITFPRPLAFTAKLAQLLPYPLWMRVMRKATKRVSLSSGK